MENTIISTIKNSGCHSAKILPITAVLDRCSAERKSAVLSAFSGAKSLIMCTFPYFTDNRPGNISLYARAHDYHAVILRRLGEQCERLKSLFPGHSFTAHVDISPLPEVLCASMSGLGDIGQNGMLITPEHGSFVFIGTVATSFEVKTEHFSPTYCQNCGACTVACPTGALQNGSFTMERCLSHLTQLRGQLSEHQALAIAQSAMVWGCDICQLACPHNAQPRQTDLPEFSRDLLPYLQSEQAQLSDRAFRRNFSGKAFSWRGVAPIRRNFELIAKK